MIIFDYTCKLNIAYSVTITRLAKYLFLKLKKNLYVKKKSWWWWVVEA